MSVGKHQFLQRRKKIANKGVSAHFEGQIKLHSFALDGNFSTKR